MSVQKFCGNSNSNIVQKNDRNFVMNPVNLTLTDFFHPLQSSQAVFFSNVHAHMLGASYNRRLVDQVV